jgi:large subunit ribosomal protein L16
MKIPKKTKYRKAQRGSMKGVSKGARELMFGDFGLVALEPFWLTSQQIEAMRMTLSRHLKKKGKLYIRVFSDHPVSKKPAETRMGKGKGDVETWVAVVKRERILVELQGIDEIFAKKILHSVSCKLPLKTRFISKNSVNLDISLKNDINLDLECNQGEK